MLPFAAHSPIIPNTENSVERYYYRRLFGIAASRALCAPSAFRIATRGAYRECRTRPRRSCDLLTMKVVHREKKYLFSRYYNVTFIYINIRIFFNAKKTFVSNKKIYLLSSIYSLSHESNLFTPFM